jgi:hypothetical protein
MLEGILGAALLFLAGMAGFLIRKYFGAYASEKGKNLATKEDIGRITAEIENVKVAIHTLGQLKTDYEQQRRDWLLSFYDTAIGMLYDNLAVNFGDLPFDEGRSLFEYQQRFGVTVGSLAKAYQRIVLYFEHEATVRVHAEEVLKAALEARKIVKNRFGSVKVTMMHEQAAFQSGDKHRIGDAVEESNKANKEYWDDMRPAADAFQIALRSYLTAVNKFLREGSELPPSVSGTQGAIR